MCFWLTVQENQIKLANTASSGSQFSQPWEVVCMGAIENNRNDNNSWFLLPAVCGTDDTPLMGTGCVDDGNDVLHVCGQCGVLFDVCYPIGADYIEPMNN